MDCLRGPHKAKPMLALALMMQANAMLRPGATSSQGLRGA